MLLSRLAESAFWLGRYLERAEDLSRALLAYELIRLDIPGEKAPGWQRLAALAGIERETATRLEPSALIALVILDRQNPSSLLGAVHAARENLRRARSLLPSECWHTLNPIYLRLEALGAAVPPADLRAILLQIMASSHQLTGQVAACMVRDEGHAFLRIGVHLERADMMLRVATIVAETLIPAHHSFRFEDVRWMGFLKSVGAYQTYRRRYHASSDFGSALELLLVEPTFPRSLAHGLLQVGRDLDGLPRNAGPLVALRDCWPPQAVNTRNALDRFAEGAIERLAHLGSVLGATYFSPADSFPGEVPALHARQRPE